MTALRRVRWCVAGCAIVGLVAVSKGADQPEKKPEGEAQKLKLFDGKTLEGWKKTAFGGEGEVKVEDGMIVMNVGASMTGITVTRKDLPTSNYELTYEAQRQTGFDFFAAATFPVGKTHVTLVNGGWGGSVTGISSVEGSDASENETGKYFEYKNKQWYKFRVQVTAERIKVFIDDKLQIELKHAGRRLGTRIETDLSKPLGFATWETAGAVKNIELRTLSADDLATINKDEP